MSKNKKKKPIKRPIKDTWLSKEAVKRVRKEFPLETSDFEKIAVTDIGELKCIRWNGRMQILYAQPLLFEYCKKLSQCERTGSKKKYRVVRVNSLIQKQHVSKLELGQFLTEHIGIVYVEHIEVKEEEAIVHFPVRGYVLKIPLVWVGVESGDVRGVCLTHFRNYIHDRAGVIRKMIGHLLSANPENPAVILNSYWDGTDDEISRIRIGEEAQTWRKLRDQTDMKSCITLLGLASRKGFVCCYADSYINYFRRAPGEVKTLIQMKLDLEEDDFTERVYKLMLA